MDTKAIRDKFTDQLKSNTGVIIFTIEEASLLLDKTTENDLNQLIDRYNFAISERDGARRAAKEYRLENEKLEKELKRKSLLLEHAVELIEDREKEIEQLQSASQLQSDVYRKLELRHREQTKELERLKADRRMQYKLFNEELEKSRELREENEQLRKKLEEVKLECDVHKGAMGVANQAFVDREEEIDQLRIQLEKATNERNKFRDYLAITVQALSVIEETLGKQKIMEDVRLWEVYTKICEALSKTKNAQMTKENQWIF